MARDGRAAPTVPYAALVSSVNTRPESSCASDMMPAAI